MDQNLFPGGEKREYEDKNSAPERTLKIMKQHMLIIYILDKTEKSKKTNTVLNNMLKYSGHRLSLSSVQSPTDLGNPIFIFFY